MNGDGFDDLLIGASNADVLRGGDGRSQNDSERPLPVSVANSSRQTTR